MKELKIKEMESGQRLDKYLGKYLKEAPKSFIYKMLRKKNITLNKKKAEGNEKLQEGDIVRLFLAEETLEKFRGSRDEGARLSLDIVYEDAHTLFVNKPSGMLSQKAESSDISLVEYITGYLLETGALSREDLETFRPGICNRLDRNTSGLVAAGKTVFGLQELSKGFHDRSFGKYYLALVEGRIEKAAHIKGYLWKDTARNQARVSEKKEKDSLPIETKYIPLGISKRGDTLLLVELVTGRTHQIRSHLSSIGHPVAGDRKYGARKTNDYYEKNYQIKDQLLHAWKLEFPRLKGCLSGLSERSLRARLPEEFQRALDGEGLWEKKIREMLEHE